MSSSAQYAATPVVGSGVVVTADTSRTAPSTVAFILSGGTSGARVDRVNIVAIGTTTASVVRLFLVEGFVGATISSITFSTTTATVTTSTAHGLSTGFKITIDGVLPFDYNVKNTAITVTGTTTFTYTMSTTPTSNALSTGAYVYTTASPTHTLLSETLVGAVTPSSTVAVASNSVSSQTNASVFPVLLPPGWTLRATIHDTQAGGGLNVIASGGRF